MIGPGAQTKSNMVVDNEKLQTYETIGHNKNVNFDSTYNLPKVEDKAESTVSRDSRKNKLFNKANE